LLNQKYDRIKGQAFHPACVPSGHVHGEIMTVCKDSWKEMLDAMKAAKIPKKFQRIFEELYFEAHPPKFEEEMKENPIGLASPEDFIAWWSQGLSLGLIKADGKVVQGPSWGRFADWWTHGMTLGIIAVEPELAIEDVDNILDYIVRSFTLGLVSTGGKPSILQMRAEKMTEEGLIPSVALPSLDSSLTDARTNPAEIWADDDLEENPFPLLVPLAMAVAPTVMDTASKAIAPRQTPPAQSPAPATGGAPAPPAGPQPPAQVPSRNNPDVPVHYIITTKEGKVYANTWGTRRQAEQTVRDIFKRTGVETTVLYPDEKQKEVKKFGNVLRRL
jgi:hypothetical protein